MLNRIPFGSASGIVSNGNVEIEGVGELGLDFRFPGVATATIAATRIGENKKLTRAGVLARTFMLPPMGNGMGGESRSVVRDTDDNGTAVGQGLVDTVRNSDSDDTGADLLLEIVMLRAPVEGSIVSQYSDHRRSCGESVGPVRG